MLPYHYCSRAQQFSLQAVSAHHPPCRKVSPHLLHVYSRSKHNPSYSLLFRSLQSHGNITTMAVTLSAVPRLTASFTSAVAGSITVSASP